MRQPFRAAIPEDATEAARLMNLARYFPRTSPEDFLDSLQSGSAYISNGALVQHHRHPYAGHIVTIGCRDDLIVDCLEFAQSLDLGNFSLMVADKFPSLVRALEQSGWTRISESICQTLAFGNFDADQEPNPDYDYACLQELDEEAIHSLYDLEIEVSADVPNFPIQQRPSFSDFLQSLEADRPNFPYSAVALRHGQVLAGARHVRRRNDCFVSSGTGVRRSERGRGLAQATKLAALQRIQQAGGAFADTSNDVSNSAMLSLNRRLGYVPIGNQFLYKPSAGPT